MKKTNFINIKSFLTKAIFEFNEEKDEGTLRINIIDKINILSITSDVIEFDAIREFNLGETSKSKLLVSNRCILYVKEEIDKETLINNIRKGLDLIHEVYADLSLTISNLTNNSPFMVMVTPPNYDKNKIIIE